MLPYTAIKWRRMKLLLAETLVLSLARGDHTYGFKDRLTDAADAIREFRETYFPATRT